MLSRRRPRHSPHAFFAPCIISKGPLHQNGARSGGAAAIERGIQSGGERGHHTHAALLVPVPAMGACEPLPKVRPDPSTNRTSDASESRTRPLCIETATSKGFARAVADSAQDRIHIWKTFFYPYVEEEKSIVFLFAIFS